MDKKKMTRSREVLLRAQRPALRSAQVMRVKWACPAGM